MTAEPLDPATWRRVTAYLDEVLDLDGGARERWLVELDGREPEIARAVRELLADQEVLNAEGFLSSSAAPTAGLVAAANVSLAGQTVGAYTIERMIGRGGMGEVWLAARSDGRFDGKVALKFLESSIAQPRLADRFTQEGRLLGRLAHPNVARLLDAGAMADQRQFLVLEYIDGERIDRHCDLRGLSVRERVRLFIDAVSAVAYAHSQLVIHRDLKPSNVLVTQDGVVKLLDFGIAKLLGEQQVAGDGLTQIDEVVMTPEYAAPEQILGELPSTGTDVYQLGMLLYVLLAGDHPLPKASSRTERIKIALEGRIPRASQFAAGARAKALRGDLDAVLEMALRPDPKERYATAAALREDLVRYLNNEPVRARDGSTLYRARKFVALHKWAVAGVSAAFVVSILFGFSMTRLAQQAQRERDRANEEAAVARRVTNVTAGLFELANPLSSGTKDISARQLLDAGVRRLQLQLNQQREDVRAALLESAGNAYRGIGAYADATKLIEQSVELRRAEAKSEPGLYAKALLDLALVKREDGDLNRASELAREAVATLAGTGRDPDVLNQAKIEWANIQRRRSEFDAAEDLVRQVLATSGTSAEAQANRAYALLLSGRLAVAQGHVDEGLEQLQQVYREQLRTDGPSGELTIEAASALADAWVVKGDPAAAEPLLRSLVEQTRQLYGDEHAQVGIALNNLGNALSDLPPKYPEAITVYLQAADVLRRTLGPTAIEVGNTYNNLGVLYIAMERWADAESVYRQAVQIRRSNLGGASPETASSGNGWAVALSHLGRDAEAEQLLRNGVQTLADALGPQHWRVGNVRRQLASVLAKRGNLAGAQQEIDLALEILGKQLGANHPRTVTARALAEQISAQRTAAVGRPRA
ncbi:serine/threonine-protein kinase [Steroidobacter sp.]|uniref:serine/threonine-protein kinase n=1 Tax=Steroidobacter sp. TaxID=1978227 RepID=UPI001A43D6BC|nr:serine/threonine-protein kinase [Steroidobacter sp.]MBL8265936.1 tetratricopeptide repeat protein [Steroidobacter sp.]